MRAEETLCETYWASLHRFVRRYGYSAHDAQDLTQEFFATLLRRESLPELIRAGEHCRCYLLRQLKHFLIAEWHRQRCLKRGGGWVRVPLDGDGGDREGMDVADAETPATMMDRRSALALLAQALERLEQEYARGGRRLLFERLRVCLPGGGDRPSYAVLAEKLAMSPCGVRAAAHRLRRRYGELLREEVARLVAQDQVAEEIRHLIAALSPLKLQGGESRGMARKNCRERLVAG